MPTEEGASTARSNSRIKAQGKQCQDSTAKTSAGIDIQGGKIPELHFLTTELNGYESVTLMPDA